MKTSCLCFPPSTDGLHSELQHRETWEVSHTVCASPHSLPKQPMASPWNKREGQDDLGQRICVALVTLLGPASRGGEARASQPPRQPRTIRAPRGGHSHPIPGTAPGAPTPPARAELNFGEPSPVFCSEQ